MSISPSLRAALYARASSDCQALNGSLAHQFAALRQRGTADGCVVAEERCFLDDGCSGATLLRPAIERLRRLVATGLVDRVYVYSPDRLSRNFADQALLVEEFRRSGAAVVFLKR